MDRAAEGGPPMPLTIVFVERKNKCDEVASSLAGEGVPAVALHGGLGQWERESALKDFSEGRVRVLVATDVASRGLDVKGIGHVINMDLPRSFEDYVHRIGKWAVVGEGGMFLVHGMGCGRRTWEMAGHDARLVLISTILAC